MSRWTFREAVWVGVAAVSYAIWVVTGAIEPVVVGGTALIMSRVDR